MLSISTSKNQSTKVRGPLFIPTYEYNYKIITRYDTILQEYYITDKRKCENTKRLTSRNSIKGPHELQKKKLRDEQKEWKDRASDDQLLILDATAVQF